MFLQIALLTLLLCISQTQSTTWPETIGNKTYPRSVVMSPDYKLYWKAEGNINTITFEIHVKTVGWVGLGWSPMGGMKGADMIIARFQNNIAIIEDRFNKVNRQPTLDKDQNQKIMKTKKITRVGDFTIVKFQRPFDTCDEEDMPIIPGTMRLIWAFGKSDVFEYHGTKNRGTRSVHLIGVRTFPDVNLGHDVKSHDIKPSKMIEIPANDTYYGCELHRLPELPKKHHVIKYEPIITPGNEKTVHHIVVYFCYTALNKANMTEDLDTEYKCYGQSKFQKYHFKCISPIFSWAIGGEPLTFPDNVGIPIGGNESWYVKLEVHYDNPGLAKGLKDQSGLRIFYTSNLREHDAGILNVRKRVPSNNTKFHIIPPGVLDFVTRAYSPAKCMEEALRRGGRTGSVNVFAGFAHAHLAGNRVVHRHVKQSTEYRPILHEKYFDFNFQSHVVFKEEIAIDKFSGFIVECNYNTTGRNKTTFGGFSTKEEMCMTFLYYYPRLPFEYAISSNRIQEVCALYQTYSDIGKDLNCNQQWNAKSTAEMSKKFANAHINWTKEAIAFWQHIEMNARVNVICRYGDKGDVVLRPASPITIDRKFQRRSVCYTSSADRIKQSALLLVTSLVSVLAFRKFE